MQPVAELDRPAAGGRGDPICPLCGGTASWPLAHMSDAGTDEQIAARHGAAAYAWRLCRTCGNGYPTCQPDLAILATLWQRNRALDDNDQTDADSIWRYRQEISRKGARRSYALFAPLRAGAPGRFLDIACGLGETVRTFADHGWDALGIDADPSVRRFHQALGIRSEIGQVETLRPDGRFDIIQIAHAIYFVTEPRRFLESLRDLLSEDGHLCIVLADFMAADDLSLPNYHHSFFPTATSMRYLLALAGFRTRLCRSRSGSCYIAAQVGAGPLPQVHPWLIRFGYRSRRLRYALFGRPKLALHRWAKRVLSAIR